MAEFQLPASLFRTSGLFPTFSSAADNSASDNFNFGQESALDMGLIASILASQDPSNYQYNGVITQGGLDIGEPDRPAITASAQEIADALNTSKDLVAQVIGATVGSNQPFVFDTAEATAAAQAPSQTAAEKALSNISAEGGFSETEANEVYDLLEAGTVTLNDVSTILNVPQAVVTAGYEQIKAQRKTPEETVDLTADTTANELLTGGLGDGSLGDAADLGLLAQTQQ